MSEAWYARTDTARESWLLLALRATTSGDVTHLTGWHIGVGNAAQLVYTDQMIRGVPEKEEDVVKALWTRINEYRHKEILLLTPTGTTVKLLRTRLMASSEVGDPSLRGLTHLSLRNILFTHFAEPEALPLPTKWLADSTLPKHQEINSDKDVIELLWQLRKLIEPLVPADELAGSQL